MAHANTECIDVERAGPGAWRRYKRLRLGALADAPDAFFTRYEDEADKPEEHWRQRLTSGAVTLIASLAGEDAGLAVVAAHSDHPGDAGLFSVWVHPQARSRGVGDALTTHAIAVARERDFTRLVLEVSDHNAGAIRMYARFGFEPTGASGHMPAPREHITEHERALAL
jgi:ribosomal protein S18 acetylase RimI-like enzyme